MRQGRLSSWGNHPRCPQIPTNCYWRGDVGPALIALTKRHGTTLAYGAGLSYGDSCFAASDHVLRTRPLDRFLSVDWSKGILAAEAGVTLQEIHAVAIPNGWFLSVTPGTQYVTLGGAIASDVHGKNHHRRGTFGRYVRRFGLFRSDTGRTVCSPDQQARLFNATIGGLGLTGIIEWAEVQLMSIRSSRIERRTQRFGSLGEMFALSDELDDKHEFCAAWIDCAIKGKGFGRGVYMAGDFALDGGLCVETTRKLAIPMTPPVSLINALTIRAFDSLYWHSAPKRRSVSRSGYGAFLYPLDRVLEWNRIYGRNGFQQYQVVIPEPAARDAVRAMLSVVVESGFCSFMTVIKRCGDLPSPGLLSFPQPGITLALDFPQTERLEAVLLPRLDAIARETGGRAYPAKDARMSGEDFRRSYPGWQEIEALRDPAIISRFWKRVTQ